MREITDISGELLIFRPYLHKSTDVGDKQFYIIDNFKNAFNGIFLLVKEGRIFRVHLLAGALVIIAGFVFKIVRTEWLIIILTIGIVLAAEGFNTAIERISDHISPEYHKNIKRVKDFAAAAVLLVSIAAAILGMIIFIPYFLDWVSVK